MTHVYNQVLQSRHIHKMLHNIKKAEGNEGIITGGDLRNGVNGFLTSYATDSVRFSQQILDKEHAGTTNVFIRWQI